jgi:hypothetical protein
MTFNSFAFIALFLPAVTIGYAALRRYISQRIARCFLLLSSLFFCVDTKPGYVRGSIS